MTRDEFRAAVFARDKGLCVFCKKTADAAHHLLERRLFTDGGYSLDNGASVCPDCHIRCETTEISVEEVRAACGITKPYIPDHLYSDQRYDKWGNPILANGTRMKGELFYDESVQKIIAPYLHLFTKLVKYPRTYHIPYSQGIGKDDRIIASMDAFLGKRIIVTKKMDGENTTFYNDYTHARSLDSRSNETRDWVKQFWSMIKFDIPEDYRICGENLYARHAIHYKDLSSYFLGFSVWNDKNICLSWDETLEWFELLGIAPVPIIYDGIYDEKLKFWDEKNWETEEGFVMRLAEPIRYGDFKDKVCKFVRHSHCQHSHWDKGPLVKNLLKKD